MVTACIGGASATRGIRAPAARHTIATLTPAHSLTAHKNFERNIGSTHVEIAVSQTHPGSFAHLLHSQRN